MNKRGGSIQVDRGRNNNLSRTQAHSRDVTVGGMDSIDLGEHSQTISKEKFSLDMSAIAPNNTSREIGESNHKPRIGNNRDNSNGQRDETDLDRNSPRSKMHMKFS